MRKCRSIISLTDDFWLSLGTYDKRVSILFETGSRRYQATDDDILFQAQQIINAPVDCGFRQDTGSLLERGCRDKAIRSQCCFGDTQQHRLPKTWLPTLRRHSFILFVK